MMIKLTSKIKFRYKYFVVFLFLIPLLACVKQVEIQESYEDPDSPLLTLLPEETVLESNWRIEKIFSTQFYKDNEDVQEVARRYFWAFENSEIHDNVLLHFEVRKMSFTPTSLQDIPQKIRGDYKFTDTRTINGVIRYQGCKLSTSEYENNDCLFILVDDALISTLWIGTKPNKATNVDTLVRLANPLLSKMENDLLTWNGY